MADQKSFWNVLGPDYTILRRILMNGKQGIQRSRIKYKAWKKRRLKGFPRAV